VSLNKGVEKPTGDNEMPKTIEQLQAEVDDAVAKFTTATASLETITAENAVLKADAEKAASEKDADNTDKDGIDKSALPEAVQKKMDAQDADIKKQADTIAKMKDDNETAVFTKQAATFDKLSLKAEDFAPILKAASKGMDEAQFAELTRVLKSANEIAGKVLKEFGSSETGEDTTAYDKLVAKGAEIAVRDGITKEQGFVKAKKENPDLWTQSRAERTAH